MQPDQIPGNDIVDLIRTESVFSDRFINKVFSLREKQAIAKAANPELSAWIRWGAKEAAFKVLSRLDKDLPFHWKKFEAILDPDGTSGRLEHAAGVVLFEAQVSEQFVHVLAGVDRIPAGIVTEIDENEDQSLEVRKLLCSYYHKETGQNAKIVMQHGQPVLASGEKRVMVSLSHHGRYVAAALFLSNSQQKNFA